MHARIHTQATHARMHTRASTHTHAHASNKRKQALARKHTQATRTHAHASKHAHACTRKQAHASKHTRTHVNLQNGHQPANMCSTYLGKPCVRSSSLHFGAQLRAGEDFQTGTLQSINLRDLQKLHGSLLLAVDWRSNFLLRWRTSIRCDGSGSVSFLCASVAPQLRRLW